MSGKIVLTKYSADNDALAMEMAPAGFETVMTSAGTPEFFAALADADYLVGYVDGQIREALYKAAPKLKLIQLLNAGYDRADLAAAVKARVPVANNGGANSTAVSEHAILLMLAVSRRLVWQHNNVAAGRWRGNSMPRVYEMRGRTLGIVGLGTIGKKTARLAQAFGMRVIYYDIDRLPEDREDALDVRFRLFGELLRESDIVSLHTPLNPSTAGMIGAAELALMKPSAILVNTARGPVVDEPALHAALSSGKIAGAGLDVFAEEPPKPDNPLLGLDNVVLTAHLAGPTWDSNRTRLRNAFDNVQRVARGEPPLWVIPELD
ncbi:phosphoglycerate dehydrogenase-like enzyme [Constrictibacter sp. MBR-5]|jgi:glyoxylate reductase/D-3-phosphoglycerate dehydrogenase|uniref:2-hydroxyacid dehydrogenase n=1 Tax=Constrictibacter sp. MBR-5 TaxID=3156467 RepID=UPI0033910573